MPRLAGPECVAPMITWLCSDDGAAVTGEVFSLSGGSICQWTKPHDGVRLVKADAGGAGLWTLDELSEQLPKCLVPSGA